MEKEKTVRKLKKEHWENVYVSKLDNEVSWYQENPETSINIIKGLNINKNKSIIDIGGGNSNFIIYLNKMGFKNLSVLDISEKALERTQQKLGMDSAKVNWIVSDILEYKPNNQFSVWHDRATFHFLTENKHIVTYVKLASDSIELNGYLILATFAPYGPTTCSGLPISQYNAECLKELFSPQFELRKNMDVVHQTPFDTSQDFTYVLLQKVK
ncbi:Methyltransferase domain-containing protein [Flavobacteriaceae bacterium MAR_2010_188]|nr:Methyltransferase domain-containing protein [Flavobacteriaceae bacterium MAR_2010_188]